MLLKLLSAFISFISYILFVFIYKKKIKKIMAEFYLPEYKNVVVLLANPNNNDWWKTLSEILLL